ncbi:hypothetical protein [Yoonia litorea]|uniref:Uncharacterized protein n=1 Tax=Yoonia litorea TaxID=1123755 RepID=A0A1I6MV50_9RHOB|nr:hypothetical protein [Yoonia litorea]SFS19524.1 hypothetical protein SAMN05444714_2223 [Yoonia litorea]
MMKPMIVLAALAATTPAVAQQSFAAPEGCEAKLTVQHKGCIVVNVWQCEEDNPGDQWIALLSQGGLFSVQRVDREFQWIEAFKITGDEELIMPADDPASLDELFANQIDTWDFTLDTDLGLERHVGYDLLTGETVIIDGEELLQTEFQGRTIDAEGDEIDASSGRQYVSEKHRMFFLGETWQAESPDDILDFSPVEFIYPGEQGFFTAEPVYECNEIDAAFRP